MFLFPAQTLEPLGDGMGWMDLFHVGRDLILKKGKFFALLKCLSH